MQQMRNNLQQGKNIINDFNGLFVAYPATTLQLVVVALHPPP
jgi:hypothetical protein